MYSVNKKVKNGLDVLLEAYADTMVALNQQGIYESILNITESTVRFNHKVLYELFSRLAAVEDEYFRAYHNNKHKRRYIRSDKTYDTEIQRIENISFKTHDPIQLGKTNPSIWKFQYYEHYYHETTNQANTITTASKGYLDGMAWIAQYYFKGVPSWTWSYQHHHAPFISDLAATLKHYTINPTFAEGQPLKPLMQLLSVLPPQTAYLLPGPLRSISSTSSSPVHYMYPQDFTQDFLYKAKFFQAIPDIPHANIDMIQKEFNKKELSKTDKKYNKKLSIIRA